VKGQRARYHKFSDKSYEELRQLAAIRKQRQKEHVAGIGRDVHEKVKVENQRLYADKLHFVEVRNTEQLLKKQKMLKLTNASLKN